MSNVSSQTNGIDLQKAKPFLDRILALQGDIETAKAAYMNDAKNLREDIKEIIAEAKDSVGIPVKSMKAIVKLHGLRAKESAIEAGLSDDEEIPYEQLKELLGDLAELPLGEAALAEAAE